MKPPQLPPLGMIGACWNVADPEKFSNAVKMLQESLTESTQKTLFCSDSLITWNKNLSFLRDPYFDYFLRSNEPTLAEKSIIWRTYLLIYFAEISSHVSGDFLELGVHTGSTVERVIECLNFEKLEKKYFLYDLFEWNEGDSHQKLAGHSDDMYKNVVARFAKYPFVTIVKGNVPDAFLDVFPEQVAFAHIDMNHPDPEVGALDMVLPRLSKGGCVVLDDYAWWGYSAQKVELDPIAKKYNLKIVDLPTGQGLLIKPF